MPIKKLKKQRKKLRILFSGREHRVRRRETMLNPPDGVEFISQQTLSSMKKDYELITYMKNMGVFKKLKNFLVYNHFIPKMFLKGVDIIYSPGKLIFNRFPWVIEIDNLAVMSYYNLSFLKIMHPIIKIQLKSKYCKKIICISEAAKKGLINYFGDKEIAEKCCVVYPFIKKQKQSKSAEYLRFLFVSTSFYIKGGKEVVNAFKKIKSPRIRLTIITKIGELLKRDVEKIKSDKRIKLLEANIPKAILFKKYYENSDIFIMPTYKDSFGMVFLEALSFGMGIIATKHYNLPEIIEDGKNGFLIDSPIHLFKKDFTPNKKFWKMNLEEYTKTTKFNSVEKQLEEKIKLLIHNLDLVEKMKKHSQIILDSRFNEKKRKKDLKNALFY